MNLRHLTIAAASLVLASCGGEGGSGGAGGGGTPPPPPPPPPAITVAVNPTIATITTSGLQQFRCDVTGSTNTQCTWSVQEQGGGTITTNGLYTAPGAEGTYHVVATAVADTSKTATATVNVQYKPWVTGYYAGYFWDVMYPPEDVDMAAMTHLVFARIAPGCGSIPPENGPCVPGSVVLAGGTSHDKGLSPDGVNSVEDYLIKKAHDAGTKAIIMLGGDGNDGAGFLASTKPAVRATFVKNVVDYMVAHDYDGVDVDWENDLDTVTAQDQLKALIAELRVEANKRDRYIAKPVLITHPNYAISINELADRGGKIAQWQLDVAAMVDQYNLMSYGIGTTWSGGGWDSWYSSPIFGAKPTTPIDLNSSIQAYVDNGVPIGKLGIGMGFYGIYFGPGITGPNQNTDNNDIYETADAALTYAELKRMGYIDNGTEHWDDMAKTSWVNYPTRPQGYVPPAPDIRNPAGFLSYESERSIAAKGDWVRQKRIGGTIIWMINYGYMKDSKTNPLLDEVKCKFLLRACQ